MIIEELKILPVFVDYCKSFATAYYCITTFANTGVEAMAVYIFLSEK